MVRAKLYIGVVIMSLVALLAGACTSKPSPAPNLEVRDAAEARDAAIIYLQANAGKNAPAGNIKWNTENITPPGLVGSTTISFTSGEWTITVAYPVVPLENTRYEVVVSSIKLGWHWKGIIEPSGNVTELSAFTQMSKEESQKIAEEFLRNSPTFVFDGIEDTVRLVDTITLRCPCCWQFIFEFESRHAGYGDRTGQALAQVITPHKAAITVEQGEVRYAVMDGKWDMINQKMLGKQ